MVIRFDQVLTNRQVFILLKVHITMQAWLIILSCLLTALGNPLADLDLFTGDFTANNDESLFQYDEVETDPLPTSLAWDLDDASLPQQGALLADSLNDASACASESAEPAVRRRARGAECAIDESEADKRPRRKNKFNPNAISGLAYPPSPADLTGSLEELICNNQGFTYAVCDSGILGNNERMFMGQYYSLSSCDLCMFVKESVLCFRSGHAAEKSNVPAETIRGILLTDLSQCKKLAASAVAHESSGVACNSHV